MARKRLIDPDFWIDEEVASMSAYARLLFIGLWAICDDQYATLPNRPTWIKAQIFPYEEIDVTPLLKEIERIDKIRLFSQNSQTFWYIKNFTRHQTISHPSKSKYPKYLSKKEDSGNTPEDSSSPPPELIKQLTNKAKTGLKSTKELMNAKWLKKKGV